MKMKFNIYKLWKNFMWLGILPFALVAGFSSPSAAQTQQAVAAPAQEMFDTPELAAAALIQAAEKYDVNSLRKILGPHSEDIIASEDPVQDKNRATEFAKLARQEMSVSLSRSKTSATMFVGPEDWPMPVPIVKRGEKWVFDTKQGHSEILARRIGANELDAITICRGFVEAQRQYSLQIHDNSGVNQYAQRLISTPGKQDGLYWENADGSPGGPVSKAVAKAIEEGYDTRKGKPTPFHGYYFKVLKGQGPAAPLGQMDFVINGAMIGGFALAAVPADYGVTGIKTFIVSYEGTVYQKDLGPDSVKKVAEMELYNPDKTWKKTNDRWPSQDLTAKNGN
jgi:hypothetical protein